MDACYTFRIQAGGQALLAGNHPAHADVLFISPYHPRAYLEPLFHAVSPRLVVPIHWDDFTRPLSQPLRPMLLTRRQGLTGWPPIRRLGLDGFAAMVRDFLPGARVLLPEIFRAYPLPGKFS
jgi:hypothetical protein